MKEQEIKKVFHNEGHVHFSTKYILTPQAFLSKIVYARRMER